MQKYILNVCTVVLLILAFLLSMFPRNCANAVILVTNKTATEAVAQPVVTFSPPLVRPKKKLCTLHRHRAQFLKPALERSVPMRTAPPSSGAYNVSFAKTNFSQYALTQIHDQKSRAFGFVSGLIASDIVEKSEINARASLLLTPALKCVLVQGLLVITTNLRMQWRDLAEQIARTMLLDLSTATVFDVMIKILPLPGGCILDFFIRFVCVQTMKFFLTSHILPEDTQLIPGV